MGGNGEFSSCTGARRGPDGGDLQVMEHSDEGCDCGGPGLHEPSLIKH